MVQLGYRAKDKFGNLWCYQWGEDDTFQIQSGPNGEYEDADHTQFEVLEIFHSTSK